jgi:hypothetical protein
MIVVGPPLRPGLVDHQYGRRSGWGKKVTDLFFTAKPGQKGDRFIFHS